MFNDMFYSPKIRACFVITALLSSGCTMTMTSAQNLTSSEPELRQAVYQKDVIIATGYANISTQKSEKPSQQRLMAIRASKLDAYRNLAEQIYGQNLNSSTTIEDMVVVNDTMRAHVEGLIYGAKVISINPIGNDSYETKLELDKKTLNNLRLMFIGLT